MSLPDVALGDVCDVRDGTHDSPKSVEIGYPLITSKNLVGGKVDLSNTTKISEEDYKNINKRSRVDFGDILMPMIGTIGNPVIVEESNPKFAIKNVALIKFRNQSPSRNYIKHVLSSDIFDHYINKVSRGGTQKFLSLGDIRKFTFKLPPLAEQKRIAAILDKAQEIKRKREQAIAKLDELAQSTFVDISKNIKDFLRLNQIATFQSGGTPSKEVNEYWDGDIAWISSADIVNNEIIYGRNHITKYGLQNSATSLAAKGVILVVTRTGVGKVAITDRDTCYSQDIVSVSIENGFNINFIAAAIRENKESFIRQARGATIQGITKEVLGSAKIPKLSIDTQQQFSQAYDLINLQRNKHLIVLDSLEKLTASLQHQAFTTGFNA